MELLFVTVLGAGIGLTLRYVLPARRTYGVLLLPAIGAVVAATVWVGLLWIGLTFDGTWIWVASLGSSLAASLAVALALPRARAEQDVRLLEELSHA